MQNEIIIYQTDELSTRLEVRIEEEIVWLTQAQMAKLFQTTPQNTTIHIRNVYKEAEFRTSGAAIGTTVPRACKRRTASALPTRTFLVTSVTVFVVWCSFLRECMLGSLYLGYRGFAPIEFFK